MLLCEWGHSQHVRLHAESPVRPSWKMATRRLDTHRFARPVRDRALSGEHECELSATRARLAMTPACDTGDVSDGTEQRNSANFEHEETPPWAGAQNAADSAHTRALLGTHLCARSDGEPKMWRGAAQRGRAGQAFALGERDVTDGTTANPLATGCRGPQRMTRLPRRSFSQGAARESGSGPSANASPRFKEPAA